MEVCGENIAQFMILFQNKNFQESNSDTTVPNTGSECFLKVGKYSPSPLTHYCGGFDWSYGAG